MHMHVNTHIQNVALGMLLHTHNYCVLSISSVSSVVSVLIDDDVRYDDMMYDDAIHAGTYDTYSSRTQPPPDLSLEQLGSFQGLDADTCKRACEDNRDCTAVLLIILGFTSSTCQLLGCAGTYISPAQRTWEQFSAFFTQTLYVMRQPRNALQCYVAREYAAGMCMYVHVIV